MPIDTSGKQLAQTPPSSDDDSPTEHRPRVPTRQQVAAASSLLAAGRDYHHELADSPSAAAAVDSDSEASDGGAHHAAALANVTSAAVKRSRARTGALRTVDPVAHAPSKRLAAAVAPGGDGEGDDDDDGAGAGAADASHPALMQRILGALGGANAAAPAARAKTADLGKLARKVARVHEEEAELGVPQERTTTDRLERATTYRRAAQELSATWDGVVERNRQLDTLSFPRATDEQQPGGGRSTREVAHRRRMTEYESEIHDILRDAGVATGVGGGGGGSANVAPTPEAALDPEALARRAESRKEILERRRALAKTRADVFNYEQKMKRIKKIKSKEYRKILRKEKQKLDALDVEYKDAVAEELKAEQRRVEERVTLRHKNTSKWIKRKLQRGEGRQSADTREAIEEQLRLHERLKVKQGHVPDGSHDESAPSDEERDPEQELRSIQTELLQGSSEPGIAPKKGLMSLKFMQRAAEKEREQVSALFSNPDGQTDKADAPMESKIRGRVSFSGNADNGNGEDLDVSNEQKLSDETRRAYDADTQNGRIGSDPNQDEVNIDIKSIVKSSTQGTGFTAVLRDRMAADEQNPWLKALEITQRNAELDAQPKMPSEGKEEDQPGDSKRPGKAPPSRRRVRVASAGPQKKRKKEPAQSGKKAASESESQPHKEPVHNKAEGKKNKRDQKGDKGNDNKKRVANREVAEHAMGSNESEDELARMEEVAAAFSGAGGADRADFQAAKDAEIEAELPTAESLNAEVLPGWGRWDGAGINKKTKRNRRESAFAMAARERLEKSRSNAIRARKDRNLDNVVLEHRRSQKAAQLTLGAVPFPFISREQWQREVANPVAPELISGTAFANNVRKRVNVKVGSVIQPMSASSAGSVEPPEAGDRHTGKRALLERRKVKVESRDSARRGLLL